MHEINSELAVKYFYNSIPQFSKIIRNFENYGFELYKYLNSEL